MDKTNSTSKMEINKSTSTMRFIMIIFKINRDKILMRLNQYSSQKSLALTKFFRVNNRTSKKVGEIS